MWEEIKLEYETTDITLKDLAEKHDVKLGTLKSRKSRESWERVATVASATPKKPVKKKKKVASGEKKVGQLFQKGNQVAKGNRGNPNPVRPPKQNTRAVKHGLFSKYLPQDSLDIIDEMEGKTTADMIWDQIIIQYAAIIRAQRIMHVKDASDVTKVVKKEKAGMFGDEFEYEFQFAWDKQASFMNAQSRAMSELRSAIKQFDEIAHVEDERRLKLEGMRLVADKTKAEINKMENGDNNEPIEILIKRKGEG